MNSNATNGSQTTRNDGRDQPLMLGALGVLAYVASMMTHEALGHGGFCLAAGGHNAMLTAWGERCSFPGVQPWGIEAAGPGLQFAAGLLAWAVLQRLPASAARLRYFFWLYMAFDLFVSSGYIAFSGFTDFGDAAVIIAPLKPHLVWRGVLVALGGLAYYFSMRLAAAELTRIVGAGEPVRNPFPLVLVPYVAAGVAACCAAALNTTMGSGTVIGLAAASSFGAGAGLLGLPGMQQGMAPRSLPPRVPIQWSTGWALAALIVAAVFLFIIGPGIGAH